MMATSTVHPAADERCNGIDDDCDDLIDDDDLNLIDATTWYIDYDSDGYGSSSYTADACDAPSGFVASDDDCDDTDGSVYPSATELYDSQDNDCDGDTDEDMWTGTGSDGSLSVTVDTDLSIDASGSRSDPDAIVYELESIDESTLTLAANADGIGAGDEVIVINLQGSSSRNDAVGTYEFASVVSVSADEIELADSLNHVFGENDNSDLTDQIVVVQRVPHYTDVDIYAGTTLTTSSWDGQSGAVLAFRATGTVWVEDGGSINVSALGYAGGDTGPNDNEDGYQGESFGGEGIGGASSATSPAYNESIAGYLSNFGGGGSNVTGGGGEYGGGATGGDAWYPGIYTAPDAGIEYGDAELDQLFMDPVGVASGMAVATMWAKTQAQAGTVAESFTLAPTQSCWKERMPSPPRAAALSTGLWNLHLWGRWRCRWKHFHPIGHHRTGIRRHTRRWRPGTKVAISVPAAMAVMAAFASIAIPAVATPKEAAKREAALQSGCSPAPGHSTVPE